MLRACLNLLCVCGSLPQHLFILLSGFLYLWWFMHGALPSHLAAFTPACAPGLSSAVLLSTETLCCMTELQVKSTLSGNSLCPKAPAPLSSLSAWLCSLRSGSSPDLCLWAGQSKGRDLAEKGLAGRGSPLRGNPSLSRGDVHQAPWGKGQVWAWCFCALWLDVAP